MPREIKGECKISDGSIGIVVSRYNASITNKLLSGAVERLKSAGVDDNAIDVVWVPGGFELPLAAQQMAGQRHASNRSVTVHFDGSALHFEEATGD